MASTNSNIIPLLGALAPTERTNQPAVPSLTPEVAHSPVPFVINSNEHNVFFGQYTFQVTLDRLKNLHETFIQYTPAMNPEQFVSKDTKAVKLLSISHPNIGLPLHQVITHIQHLNIIVPMFHHTAWTRGIQTLANEKPFKDLPHLVAALNNLKDFSSLKTVKLSVVKEVGAWNQEMQNTAEFRDFIWGVGWLKKETGYWVTLETSGSRYSEDRTLKQDCDVQVDVKVYLETGEEVGAWSSDHFMTTFGSLVNWR